MRLRQQLLTKNDCYRAGKPTAPPAPATELMVPSSRPNTMARPVTMPATAAHSFPELSWAVCAAVIAFLLGRVGL